MGRTAPAATPRRGARASGRDRSFVSSQITHTIRSVHCGVSIHHKVSPVQMMSLTEGFSQPANGGAVVGLSGTGAKESPSQENGSRIFLAVALESLGPRVSPL